MTKENQVWETWLGRRERKKYSGYGKLFQFLRVYGDNERCDLSAASRESGSSLVVSKFRYTGDGGGEDRVGNGAGRGALAWEEEVGPTLGREYVDLPPSVLG